MKNFLMLIIFCSFSIHGFAQYKYEKEFRIKESDVPENAVNFVNEMNFSSRIKWYREIGQDIRYYEAKTKHKGDRYSIKFSEEGTLVDVEIEMAESDMPVDTYNKIREHLKSEYDKYSIEKIQIQFLGNQKRVLEFLQNRDDKNGIETNFEIVLSTKVKGSYVMFEYLFSENGSLIRKSKIVLKSTDNIIY